MTQCLQTFTSDFILKPAVVVSNGRLILRLSAMSDIDIKPQDLTAEDRHLSEETTNGQTLDSSVNKEDNKSETNESRTNPPIDSSKILVINFGSLYVRIGRASDSSPKSVYNVLATKNRSNRVPAVRDSCLMPINAVTKEMAKTLIDSQNSMTNTLAAFPTSSGRLRSLSTKSVITDFNKRSKPIVLSKCDKKWTQLEDNKEFVIGEEALYLKDIESFHVRWPIRRGRLNVNQNLCGSLTSVIADLQTICSEVIQKQLDIELNQLTDYKVVLMIPDVYNRNHIKYLMEMLLNGLKFESCIVIHEAVCATFGAGLSHACVVDVGDQKTSICCIEDGFGSKNTRLTLDYGGSDITQLFHYLLKQKAFPYECTSDANTSALFLHELKKKFCHLNPDICGQHEKHFRVCLPEQPVLDYKILVGDECLLAPLGLFFPDMFGLTLSGGKRMQVLQRNDGHSDDPFDENYLIQTKRKYGESNETLGQSIEANAEPVIEDELDGCDVTHNEKDISFNSDQQLLSLDQSIIQCIDHCESEDLKKRLFSSILLIGGGLAFNGIDRWLHSRLSAQLPPQFEGQPIEIIVKPKDTDPQILSWRGAAVMAVLDSAQEMWISRDEWQKSGIRTVREKASFVF